ncbi:permease [Candidatus Magnetoovum chiemensis]|nr:permease [Candidatus Magnetoovum chiemensis]
MFLRPRIRGQFPSLIKLSYSFIISILILINTITFYTAYSKTSIANAVFSHYIAPIIVAMLSPFILKEKTGIRTVSAIVISTTGLWVLLNDVKLSDFIDFIVSYGKVANNDASGIFFGIISGFAYGLLIVFVRILTQKIEPHIMIFCQNSFLLIMLLPFVDVFPLEYLWVFIIMGIFNATIAPNLYYLGLKSIEANRTAILGYFEPLSAVVLGMLFLNEYPKTMTIFGGALIIFSGYLVINKSDD